MIADRMTMLSASDGHQFRAYTVTPDGQHITGSLVLLHEIFGINTYMRQMAGIYAQHGFRTIVPDLFARQELDVELGYDPLDFTHAIALRDKLDWNTVVLDIEAAVTDARACPRSNGKVGILGYCLGGGLAVLAAAENTVDTAVSYYGVGVQDKLQLAEQITVPMLFHFAADDHYCPPAARKAIEQAFANHEHVSFHLYDGVGHAFATFGRDTFEPNSTEMAFGRTLAHLTQWLTP